MTNIVKYEKICQNIIDDFCLKQKLKFDFWVGDIIGGIAYFNDDIVFNMDEIILDMKTYQRPNLILEWFHDSINSEKTNGKFINYKSYTMGLRYEFLNDN